MKKILLSLTGLLLGIAAICQTSISSNEREKALDHLRITSENLITLLDELSENQLNYKSDKTSWSIAECVEHLTISEKNLIDMIQMGLKAEADPSKTNLAMTDDQLLHVISSREQKVKTRKEFEPTNSFGDYKRTLKTFKERRKANIKFVKKTDADLRNHYLQFPFGLIDTYQGILFMSGHTQRHADQIKEIMASTDFPS